MAQEQAGTPASEPMTIEQRIAAKFNVDAGEPGPQPEGPQEASASVEEPQVEETQEEAEEQPAEDSGYEEVDIDGEVYRVPPKLKEAVLRQSDYTRKTQEVAKAREQVTLQLKALEQQQQFQQFVEPEVKELQGLQDKIKSYSDISWLRSLDSEQRSLAQIEVGALKERAGEIVESLKAKK